MKKIWIFTFLLFSFGLTAQDSYQHYMCALPNWTAGNGNAAYDKESGDYFFVEWQRDWTISLNGALHIKRVDNNGNYLESKYFITDSHPYSAHYISSVEIQGQDLVIFFNRNINESTQYNDFFIYRLNKDLGGEYAAQRFFYPVADPKITSLKVADTEMRGDKIYFVGSAFSPIYGTQDLSNSRVLFGVIHENGAMDYQLLEVDAVSVEGLNLRNKKYGFFISGRYNAANGSHYPLLISGKLQSNYQLTIEWAKAYTSLSVDEQNSTNGTKGLAVPILNRFDTYKYPAFVARGPQGKKLVVTLFSPVDGTAIKNAEFILPTEVELLDAKRYYDDNVKDAFMVLTIQKTPYSFTNTTSYIFNHKGLFNSNATWHNLLYGTNFHSVWGRSFIRNSNRKVALSLMSNTPGNTWEDFHRSTLLYSDDPYFNCLSSIDLKQSFFLLNPMEDVKLEPYVYPFLEEDRLMSIPINFSMTTIDGCLKNARRTSDSEELAVPSQSFSLSPNPAADYLHLTLPKNLDTATLTLRITDITGRQLIENAIDASRKQLNISQLNPGVYLVQFYSKDGLLHTEKLVKQ